MLKITDVKKWAKEHGYNIVKEKIDDESAKYYWNKISDPSINGISPSVSKVALAVYNNITDNVHLEYQQSYKEGVIQ
jgi:tRNA A22 N-methylase